jgi:hypothetical protein
MVSDGHAAGRGSRSPRNFSASARIEPAMSQRIAAIRNGGIVSSEIRMAR